MAGYLWKIGKAFVKSRQGKIFLASPFTFICFTPVFWLCLNHGVDALFCNIGGSLTAISTYLLAVYVFKTELANPRKFNSAKIIALGILLFSLGKFLGGGFHSLLQQNSVFMTVLILAWLLLSYAAFPPVGSIFSRQVQKPTSSDELQKPSRPVDAMFLTALGFTSALPAAFILQLIFQPGLATQLLKPLFLDLKPFLVYAVIDVIQWWLRHYSFNRLGASRVQTWISCVPAATLLMLMAYSSPFEGFTWPAYALAILGIATVVFGGIQLARNKGPEVKPGIQQTRRISSIFAVSLLVILLAAIPIVGIGLFKGKYSWSPFQVMFSAHLISAFLAWLCYFGGRLRNNAAPALANNSKLQTSSTRMGRMLPELNWLWGIMGARKYKIMPQAVVYPEGEDVWTAEELNCPSM